MILSVRDRPYGGFRSVNDNLYHIVLSCHAERTQYPILISYQFVASLAYRILTPEWEIACLKKPLWRAIYKEYDFESIPDIFVFSYKIEGRDSIERLYDEYAYVFTDYVELLKLGKTLKILYRIFPCVPQES